jgi:hypothetical protein
MKRDGDVVPDELLAMLPPYTEKAGRENGASGSGGF